MDLSVLLCECVFSFFVCNLAPEHLSSVLFEHWIYMLTVIYLNEAC